MNQDPINPTATVPGQVTDPVVPTSVVDPSAPVQPTPAPEAPVSETPAVPATPEPVVPGAPAEGTTTGDQGAGTPPAPTPAA